VEEISTDFFRIEIPLPDSPLPYVNAYLIRSDRRHLLIDTGLNRSKCLTVMKDSFQQLGVNLDDTDIFITHFHADHFGLAKALVRKTTTVFFNGPDAEILKSWQGIDTLLPFADLHGFPAGPLKTAFDDFPAIKLPTEWIPEMTFLSDNQTITCGSYSFRCIETAGHTPGHLCLYEPDKKLLISGDHLLNEISPIIHCWLNRGNPLKSFLESLKKIDAVGIDLVLPGHGLPFNDHRRRIRELIAHHQERLSELIDILNKASFPAYEIASKMTWNIPSNDWEHLPTVHKWFATCEAIAHLRYLEDSGLVKTMMDKGVYYYSLNG
jgi:glyoxylase-like metal-dependent hydrolase (beta-lactamase superfamily II)